MNAAKPAKASPMLRNRLYVLAFAGGLLASVWASFAVIADLGPAMIGDGVRSRMVAIKVQAGHP